MRIEEFREEMERYRSMVFSEGIEYKDAMLSFRRLSTLYKKFDRAERDMANRVLGEWALSNRVEVRYDALALIKSFNVVQAEAALKQLIIMLNDSSEPEAPFERAKVERILEEFSPDVD